jgi:hypothetical protein
MENLMRLTDVALSTATPVAGSRTPTRKPAEGAAGPAVVSERPAAAPHPDEVAAAKLQKAAGLAQAARVVAAQNELASASVRGDRLSQDLAPLP